MDTTCPGGSRTHCLLLYQSFEETFIAWLSLADTYKTWRTWVSFQSPFAVLIDGTLNLRAHVHKLGGPLGNRTPITDLQGQCNPIILAALNLVDAVGNDPTECCHVRVTAGTASLTVYTSILKYTPYLSHDENKFHLQTQIVRPRI